MEQPDTIPKHMQSTISMLSAAYPAGIPSEDFYPLILLLHEVGGMSNRSVAAALAFFHGKEEKAYKEYLYEVGHLSPTEGVSPEQVERIREKLKPYGFEIWLEEKG